MNKNQLTGVILLLIGIGLGGFAYAHRPPEGFFDALNRSGSWAFKPEFYYAALGIAVLFVLAGIARLTKKTPNTPA